MKRKRGNKKGKQKKTAVVGAKEAVLNVSSVNTEENSGLDDFDNDEIDSGMEAGTPPSLGTDLAEKIASINSDGLTEKAAVKSVYGRVKVKIKTSKVLDSQLNSSDAPTQSDTDKSSQQVGLEKCGMISERTEDSANSLPEMNRGPLGNPSKKSGSIKIKSSRGIGSSSLSLGNIAVQSEKTPHKEPELPHRGPRYNRKELNDSLEVIKKIMKMEAAEPFNAPVNPIALGIPDYFDVIDTPMDFGTICSNLDNGVKYMNSADVFKDVQYIWDNCYKYNNKGDYIVELMKRVKKNFMKYWTAAGLHSEQPQSNNGSESFHAKDASPSTHGKMLKSAHLKHKSRKRHGVKKHKDDCLCAICVMMRRRQEREEETVQIVVDLSGTTNSPLAHEVKPEETSHTESPRGEDSSSNMENSEGPDADGESEENGEEVKPEAIDQPYGQERNELNKDRELEGQMKEDGEVSDHSDSDNRSEDERNGQDQIPAAESGENIQTVDHKEETLAHHENEAVEQQNSKELPGKQREKSRLYENFIRYENPTLLDLCGTLFPANHNKSIWGGRRSLVRHQKDVRSSSIHEAVRSLMP